MSANVQATVTKRRGIANFRISKYRFLFLIRIVIDGFKKLKQNPVVAVVIALIVLILMLGGMFIVTAIGPFVTFPGAIAIDLVGLWLLLRVLVRALVFPGSVVCWKRSTEQSFKVEIAKQFCHHLSHLRSFLLQLSGESPERLWTLEKAGYGTTVLDTLVRNFQMQEKDQVVLSKQQQMISELATSVIHWLKESFLQRDGVRVSLYDYLEGKCGSNQSDFFGIFPQDGPTKVLPRLQPYLNISDFNINIASLSDLIATLKELTTKSKANCLVRARNFLTVPTIGSLHALRAELSFRYKGQQIWVRGKGTCLDAMFIPSPRLRNSLAQEGAPDITAAPVVICCNPNAGYYETLVYQNDNIDFFLERGMGVMLFNYRGYGRSKGRPSPGAVQDDADLIASHLFSAGCKHVGIYGRSIGGVGACYVAAKHQVSFLVADRTFSSLGLTAKYTYGNWAEQGLRVCATTCDNTDYYAKASPSKMKLLMCDPKDAIIPDFSALRTSLALRKVEQQGFSERLTFSDLQYERIAQAYEYLNVVVGACDPGAHETRAPTFKTTERKEEGRRYVRADDAPQSWADLKWLEDNAELVRNNIPDDLLGILRQAQDSFGYGFNAVGTSIQDALSSENNAGNPVRCLKCLIANLQVWGAIPVDSIPPRSEWKSSGGANHNEVMRYLTGTETNPKTALKTEQKTTPEDIADFYIFVAKAQIFTRHQELRVIATTFNLRENIDSEVSEVIRLAKEAVMEFDNFVGQIARFFKKTDIGTHDAASTGVPTSDSSDEGEIRKRDSLLDVEMVSPRDLLGHQIILDCGHNGTIEPYEQRILAFYLDPVIQQMVNECENDRVGTV